MLGKYGRSGIGLVKYHRGFGRRADERLMDADRRLSRDQRSQICLTALEWLNAANWHTRPSLEAQTRKVSRVCTDIDHAGGRKSHSRELI